MTSSSIDDVRARLPGRMLRDEQRLRRRLDQAGSVTDPARRERQTAY